MNLPNRLTLLRILILLPILLFLLPLPGSQFAGWNAFVMGPGPLVALLLFALASLTDWLDGHIARSRGQITKLGAFLDPIADKMLVLAVFIALVERGRIPSLVPIIVLLREFAISGIRMLAAERGIVIAAGWLGKVKTVTQLIALHLILLECGLRGLVGSTDGSFASIITILTWLGNLALVVSIVMTIWSGLDYFNKNRDVLSDTGA
ncbi:MAG: CDP-diacylglycerol--glycerol-3-phosphate 3-phosphatidyltransferase [Bacillota bacterium]|nr:CDP-diacylglycerol--glycerol-3-phosphate 3-phosphatidyltransferase [Bacillota bacterium]